MKKNKKDSGKSPEWIKGSKAGDRAARYGFNRPAENKFHSKSEDYKQSYYATFDKVTLQLQKAKQNEASTSQTIHIANEDQATYKKGLIAGKNAANQGCRRPCSTSLKFHYQPEAFRIGYLAGYDKAAQSINIEEKAGLKSAHYDQRIGKRRSVNDAYFTKKSASFIRSYFDLLAPVINATSSLSSNLIINQPINEEERNNETVINDRYLESINAVSLNNDFYSTDTPLPSPIPFNTLNEVESDTSLIDSHVTTQSEANIIEETINFDELPFLEPTLFNINLHSGQNLQIQSLANQQNFIASQTSLTTFSFFSTSNPNNNQISAQTASNYLNFFLNDHNEDVYPTSANTRPLNFNQ